MRNGVSGLLGILAVIAVFHAHRSMEEASITGQIFPVNQIHSIVAVHGKDSIKIFSSNGRFGMDLAPGKWKLVIPVQEKNPAYFERTLNVSKGERLDLGQIRMLP